MFWKYPLEIQAYNSQTNDSYVLTFQTKKEHLEYCKQQFKLPGEYNLKNTKKWQETGNHYASTVTRPNFEGGRYHNFLKGSVQAKKWTAIERDRILNGVVFDGIYLPPFYYWYLNFCPIYNDVEKKKQFANVWDGDLWYFHYCMICILSGKHIGGVKGRQKGYSFKHMAILYWSYSWMENSVNTIGSSDERLVKKSWRFLEGYRNHLNSNTPWIRGPQIPKSLEWYEIQYDENNTPRGLNSKLSGVTFKQKADNDVGGTQTIFNYEEPGVSPTLLETIEFIRPAVEHGAVVTGVIIANGSVGNLDDADGLKTIFYNPRDYNFYPLKNIWDKKPGHAEECCIFISEAYNMIGEDEEGLVEEGRPFMDGDGNSDVKFALEWIEAKAKQLKNSKKKAELKQLALSQKCTSPEQAFATRSVSEWPTEYMQRQQERLDLAEENDKLSEPVKKGLLFEDEEGNSKLREFSDSFPAPPELGYPIDPEIEDKRGCVTIYKMPSSSKPEFKIHFGGLDPVLAEVTHTSNSVASLHIFECAHEVEYQDNKGRIKKRIEGDKLVASYFGRFDSIEKTNEQCWLLIKMYNAFTLVERNVPNFISYMQRNGRAEYFLAKESDFPMFKDLPIDVQLRQGGKFGFHKGRETENGTSIWTQMKAYAKEYFMAEYGRDYIGDTEEVLKIFRGIDRLPDRWLIEEFLQDNGKVNTDRIVSFIASLFLCKITYQNRAIKKISEIKKEKPKQRQEIYSPKSMLQGMNKTIARPTTKTRSLL